MSRVLKYGFFFAFCILQVTLYAQKESDKLRQQQKDLEKKIAFTKNLLGSTQNTKSSTLAELNLVNRQIEYRQALINNINNQLNQIERDINQSSEEINILGKRIKKLKAQYAAMIRYAYKHRNQYSGLMFVFSADDFNQAYRRIKYLQQIQEYRVRQVALIKENQVELEQTIGLLKSQKEEKEKLLKNKDKEKANFYQDKVKQQETLKKIKAQEQELRKQLEEQEAQKRKIEQAIQLAIKKEIEKERETKGKNFAETKEIKLAAEGFEANKGKLPMPVQGEITGKFGRQAHPVHVGVYTENNGIDITTAKNATVRALYKGTVTAVLSIPGAGKAVMLSHGNYRTVYANLQESYVSTNDVVDTKQALGALMPDESGMRSKAHLEIWKISNSGMDKLNPTYWLYR